MSVCVQASPSVQALPFGLAGVEQTPFAGLQVPASWHWSSAGQTTGFEPVQVPAWQVSVCVQTLPSLPARAGARLASVGLRADVAVIAGGPVGPARSGAGAARRVAGAGDVALVERGADDGVRPDAGAGLAGVGLGAGIAVGAGAAVRLGRGGAGAAGRTADVRSVAALGCGAEA